MKNKVDIVIPVHNRTKLLKRILDYYNEYGQDFNFIIADSSNKINKAINKKLVESFTKLKILYIDKFSEDLPQHIKFGKMINYINNKYCVFCPDDDFIIPNGIRSCIDFLEKNPDYVAAHGTYIGFYLFKGILKYQKFLWNLRYHNYSISDNTPHLRLFTHLSNFTLLLWAVRRTNVVRNCYKELLKINFDPELLLMFGELLPDMLTVISGKVKRLETLYAARQYFFSIANNYLTLLDTVKTDFYLQEYNKFKNCLINNLQVKEKIARYKAEQIIDSAMEKYLKSYSSYQEYLVNKVNRLLNHGPSWIARALRTFHATYLFSKKKEGTIDTFDQLSSKYYQDFESIRRIVLKYNI